MPAELPAPAEASPAFDDELEALGHFAFEWQAGRGWWSSPGGRALLGLAPGDGFVDDATWWSRVHADDRGSAIANGAALHHGAARCQCSFRLANGVPDHERWVQIRARAAARDDGGALLRLRGTLTAIEDAAHERLAARQHELRLVEAVDHAHIAWYERRGTRVYGSSTIAELFDLDDATGPWEMSEIFDRLPPLEFQRHCHDLRVARGAGDALSATHVTGYRIVRRDGSARDVEIRYRIVDAGEPLQTYGLIFDVTATKALEAKFQDAMEHAGVAWFERDIASDVLSGSRSLWRLYGVDPGIQPLRFAALVDRIHPEDWDTHPAHAQQLREASRALGGLPGDGPTGTLRYRVRRDDGGWRWIEVRYVIRFDGHGGGTASGLVFDVTAAQQAEDELRAGRSRLLLALEAGSMATWEWDADKQVVQSRDVLAELYGLPTAGPWEIPELLARVHPEDRERVGREVGAAIGGSGQEMLSTEFRLRRGDGSERWFEARARHTESGVIGVSFDLTARKIAELEEERLRRQLQQSQKMEAIGQLTGGIAHDFNNILASVLGYADLALKRYGEAMPERLAVYVREMQAGGRRARDLVRQMLAFSRNEGGELEPVAIADIVEQAIRMLRPTLPASLCIDTRIAADLPAVLADSVQLQQVVMNLCINARDAMGGVGNLQVSLEHGAVATARCASCQQAFAGDFVIFTLRDDGPGIDPERQPRIFEPFYTTKATGQGTGMGLSMVHGIVHRLGGHVRLDSAPGRGSTFEILLPATTAATRVAEQAPVRRPARECRGDILVVDDEPTVARFVAETLELEGYCTETAADPRQALDDLTAGRRRADLVISDQTMPGLTGAELTARLRAACPQLPVILMSGYSATLDADKALACGACDYLAKPLDSDALLTAVDRALGDAATA